MGQRLGSPRTACPCGKCPGQSSKTTDIQARVATARWENTSWVQNMERKSPRIMNCTKTTTMITAGHAPPTFSRQFVVAQSRRKAQCGCRIQSKVNVKKKLKPPGFLDLATYTSSLNGSCTVVVHVHAAYLVLSRRCPVPPLTINGGHLQCNGGGWADRYWIDVPRTVRVYITPGARLLRLTTRLTRSRFCFCFVCRSE